MESYQPSFLGYDFRGSYSPFYNGFQWLSSPYNQSLGISYPLDPNSRLNNSLSMFKTYYPSCSLLTAKYPFESDNLIDQSTLNSAYSHRSTDDMHSLFGDPSLLLTQLIDELEDSSLRSLPTNAQSTIYNLSEDHDIHFSYQDKIGTFSEPLSCTPAELSVSGFMQNEVNKSVTDFNHDNEIGDYLAERVEPGFLSSLESQHDTINLQNSFNHLKIISPKFSGIERPRQISKNRGNHISANGLSFSIDDTHHTKNGIFNIDHEEDNDEYEADLDRLLKQMDRREFQESWSKDWTLGLIRFCKYMQLSEKMQIGPAIKLKSDDNKCVILVLKKVFQAKPPAGWPSHGVRLQIQCGGYIQDILAWSIINRETWKIIMPLIAKGITQLIKKVGGVHKLKNGHQPYFNACRNALREDNSLFLLLKEYSRGVNTKKRRQNIFENEVKESQID